MSVAVFARQCRINDPDRERQEIAVEVADAAPEEQEGRIKIVQGDDIILLTPEEWEKVEIAIGCMLRREWP